MQRPLTAEELAAAPPSPLTAEELVAAPPSPLAAALHTAAAAERPWEVATPRETPRDTGKHSDTANASNLHQT